MKIQEYTLENWRELLEKDWDYLKKDNGSGNVENIFSHLLMEISKELQVIENILK